MGVQVVLVVLLMFASTVKSEGGLEGGEDSGTDVKKGGVEFSRSTVTLTCPENGILHAGYDSTTNNAGNEGSMIVTPYEKPLKYHCKFQGTSEKKYLFYVKGRACENCFELDATVFLVAIVVDVAGTVVVMMIIFSCSRKRSSDAPAHSSKPPVPSGSRAPTVPSRDYEQLNPRTRATDTYSTVVNRMG